VYAGAVLADDSPDGGVYKSVDGGEDWQKVIGELRVSGLAVDPLATHKVYMGTYNNGIFFSTNDGQSWTREPGPLGQLSIESLAVTTVPSRTIILVGVAGDLLIGGARAAEGRVTALTSQAQFYGGGVYQLTIDHRRASNRIFIPLVVKN